MKRKMAQDVRLLSASNASVKAELDEARRKIADVTTALAKRSDAQEKKVIGELQLIETMIRNFATGPRNANTLPSNAKPGEGAGLLPVLEFATPESEMLEIIRRAL